MFQKNFFNKVKWENSDVRVILMKFFQFFIVLLTINVGIVILMIFKKFFLYSDSAHRDLSGKHPSKVYDDPKIFLY